jgi:ATPase subunit of ABC transporter with duplicated ATPase domains
MARQFIYHMQGLSKSYPGNRKILEDINLSFYPDAKIGVLGVNGSGKSTLLRIMAGIDTEFAGEAWAAEGARVGYLEQEPQLDAGKSVREAARRDRGQGPVGSRFQDRSGDGRATLPAR